MKILKLAQKMIVCIQGWLPHYRLDFFNALNTWENVTVVHSGKPSRRTSDRFKEVILPLKSVGPFRFQRGLLELIEQTSPSTIIAMFDIRWVNTFDAMMRYDQRINWVWWGLDQGKSSLGNLAKIFIARRNNPIVFYNEFTRQSFAKKLRNENRLFVANNTIHVPSRAKSFLNPVKNRIINVGTLDARKQNEITIRVFSEIVRETRKNFRLTFIGEGAELYRLKDLVAELGMQQHIEFTGNITDSDTLAIYYSDAIASVSFGQAGLAVLQSMAYGVPFVTKKSAISGGEKYNIIHGENGLICEDSSLSLKYTLKTLMVDLDYARTLGCAAYDYYTNFASIENMVNKFSAAIEYGRGSND